MLSPLWQTAIGAAAAIVGGLVAAIWQTSRADKLAQSIRRAERREQGLLDLIAVVAPTYSQILELYGRVENGQNAAQYNEARQFANRVTLHWESAAQGVIPDRAIVIAYRYLNAAIQEGLPGGEGTLDRIRALSSGEQQAGQDFKRDLGLVVGRLQEFMRAIQEQVAGLQGRDSSRRRFPDAAGSRVRKVRKSFGRRISG
jgi:hypothetical protein